MWKFGICLWTLCFGMSQGECQKKSFDLNIGSQWPRLYGESISDSGSYVLYWVIRNNTNRTLVVSDSIGTVLGNFRNALIDQFLDAGTAAVLTTGDSLCIFSCRWRKSHWLTLVKSFQTTRGFRRTWLACKRTWGGVTLLDIDKGDSITIPQALDVSVNKEGNGCFVDQHGAGHVDYLSAVSLENFPAVRLDTIWSGQNPVNFTFGKGGRRLVFEAGDKGRGGKAIWYFDSGMHRAQLVVDVDSRGMEEHTSITAQPLTLSGDGEKVFFSVERQDRDSTHSPAWTGIHVHSTHDDVLWGTGDEGNSVRSMVCKIGGGPVIGLSDYGSSIQFDPGKASDYVLIKTRVNEGEAYWRKDARPTYYLVATKDGSRTVVAKGCWGTPVQFSPGGKYLWWFDRSHATYVTYDIEQRSQQDVGRSIPVPVRNERWDMPSPAPAYGVAGWLEGDKGMFIEDKYDIWLVDPGGVKTSSLFTGGYGRRHKVVLRFIYVNGEHPETQVPVKEGQKMLLCGFNELTKQNGFFQIPESTWGHVQELTMQDRFFYFPDHFSFVEQPEYLKKAEGAAAYMLTEMSSTDFGNLVLTRDFKHFRPITSLEPQKEYNWLQAELVHWRTFDGRPGTGILYKPEDFDERKKYPVVFHFYESMSAGLNLFLTPGLSNGAINIPWLVNRGYLVFCPDIGYRIGNLGNDVYNYVVSAAMMMKEKPWVDGKGLGLEGHSFGGFEVNYLITRTNIFAAAVSVEGITDLASMSGALRFAHFDSHQMPEVGQQRLGKSLWVDPQIYVKNSPVFFTDRVKTPLLMVDNPEDDNVPWAQGVEFFTALRRAGKDAWLLEYDHERHMLDEDKPRRDFTIRMGAFFDYYLKGKERPSWMK